jgi:basic membrane lipoprotein Med (substrate-binding protein (PBP1-ABC) superfamily)
VDTAAIDENELIFTVSPAQMQETLRCAIHFPKLHFLNCSVNLSHTKVRTYYGRMYEAKAILGALAASLCENHKIGYVADYPIFGSVAEINAFAIGAAMIDPNIKIYLEWTSVEGSNWRLSMKENGVSIISGQDFIKPNTASREYGLFKMMDDGSVQNLAVPMWNWGKFYELIIQSYLDGRWDETPTSQAVNYWWGMSAGVIELILSDKLSYYSKKLVMNLQNAMVQDALGPFAGEIHTQDGDVLAMDMTKLGSEEILTMDWLNDNVIGHIPKLEELTESAKNVVLVSGIKNDDL